MTTLVKPDGKIEFGICEKAISDVNHMDYDLETPMGSKVSGLMKRLRFNQFNFIGIMGPEIMAGFAVIDLKSVSNGFFYIYDRKSGELFETKKLASTFKASIKPDPSNMDSSFKSSGLTINIKGGRLSAKGRGISLDARLDFDNTQPLRICTRAGYRGWVYTEKTSPVKISGNITYNGKILNISSPDYMALVDWSAGFMRRNTYWNWASIACTLPDNRSLGLNLASGVNETGFTENAFWIDGKMIKTDTVHFQFDSNDLMGKWQINSFDKKIDLEFTPENYREEKTNALLLASRFTQLMGTFNGTFTTDEGEKISVSNVPGWTEDHYAKW